MHPGGVAAGPPYLADNSPGPNRQPGHERGADPIEVGVAGAKVSRAQDDEVAQRRVKPHLRHRGVGRG